MSNRYTSPDLSRQLAEAGIGEPLEFQKVRCGSPECASSFGAGEVHECTDDWCVDPCVRALDLEDVLEEIRRLDGGRDNAIVLRLFRSGSAYCEVGESTSYSNVSVVEAAALCLQLMLLKECKL